MKTLEPDEPHRKRKTRELARRSSRTRTQVKSGKPLSVLAQTGTVISAAGPWWAVIPTSETTGVGADPLEVVFCTVSGVVDAPEGRTLVTVGDHVWFIADSGSTEHNQPTGSIVRVEERTTLLSRKAAGRARKEQVLVANVDQLAIVIAAAQPDYHRRLIDRYLIAADKGDLDPMIIVNKLDLVGGELLEVILEDLRVYSDVLDLNVFFLSTVTGNGIEELREYLVGKCTLLAGQSGVGKSSIINALTSNRLKVGKISRMYNKGTHTTTTSTVIPLAEGGSVVDSPGIREFSIWELDAEELPYYFVEFTDYAEHCRFSPCTHTHEPGCAVKEAVDKGLIEEGRYISYVVLREEITS